MESQAKWPAQAPEKVQWGLGRSLVSLDPLLFRWPIFCFQEERKSWSPVQIVPSLKTKCCIFHYHCPFWPGNGLCQPGFHPCSFFHDENDPQSSDTPATTQPGIELSLPLHQLYLSGLKYPCPSMNVLGPAEIVHCVTCVHTWWTMIKQ